MGKKAKNEAPNPNHVANREMMQRLNFLYQASFYLNSLSASFNLDEQSTDDLERVSRSYVRSMKMVANKKVVKMDPTVKRTLCKGCNTVLIPGSTASVRVKSSKSHGHAVTYSCFACRAWRRIPAPPVLLINDDDTSHPPTHPVPSSSDTQDMDDHAQRDPDACQTELKGQPAVSSQAKIKKKKKKTPTPRLPHLFERNAGHIVFCGNERLNTEDSSGIHAS